MNTTERKRSDEAARFPLRLAPTNAKVHTALSMLLVGTAYYLGAQIGFKLNFPGTPISVFWPPNAILMAALILTPMRQWWLYLLAVLPAHVFVQWQNAVPAPAILGWYISNSSEALIGAFGMQYFSRERPQLDSLRQMVVFVACVVIAAPLFSSFLDAAVVVLTGLGDDYWYLVRVRTLSNALTNLALVPLILTWSASSALWFSGVPRRRYVEAGLLGLSLLIVGVIVFGQDQGNRSSLPALLYAPLPLLLWAAVRFGPTGASSALVFTALISAVSAINGQGPFSMLSPAENVLSLRLFLMAMSVPILFLAALIRERSLTEAALRRSQAAVQQSEERFRRAMLSAPIPIMIHAEDGEVLQINHAWTELSGYSHADIPTIGDWTERAYGVRRAVASSNLERLYAGDGRIHEGTDTLRTRSGEQRAWEFTSAPLGLAPDGRRLIVSTAMDVTERVQAYQLLEQRVAGRTADLAQVNAALQAEIAERQRTEQALRQQEELFRLTFDQAPIGASMSRLDYHLVRVNDAYSQIMGYTRDELLDLDFVAITHPDDREADLSQAQELRAGAIDQYALNKRYIKKNGEVIWVHLTAGLVRDAAGAPLYFLAMVEDITQRMRVEEALRQSEALLRTMIDTIPFLVWGRDRDQRLMFQNTMYSDFFKRQRGLYPADSRFGPEMGALWERRNARALAGEIVREETRYVLGDETRDVEEIIAPIRDGDTITGIVGVWVDITERNQAQEALLWQLRYQRALAHCSRILLGTSESDAQRDHLLESALQQLLQAAEIDRATLYQNFNMSEEGAYARMVLYVDNSGLPLPPRAEVLDLVRWADLPAVAQRRLAAGRAWGGQAEMLFEDHPLLPVLRKQDIRSFLAVPIFAGNRWWGTVTFIDCKSDRVWQEREKLLLQTAAEMIATFQQRIAIEQALRDHIDELSALSEIAQALTRWADLPRALDQIRPRLLDLFDAEEISFGILDANGTGLSHLLRISASQTTSFSPPLALADDPKLREVIDRGQAVVMTDTRLAGQHVRKDKSARDTHAHCQLLLPVRARDSVIGLMRIVAAQPDRVYVAADLPLAQTIAGTLANAFENGRLFANEQRLRQIAESLREVATVVTSSLNFETVVRTIFEQLHHVLHYDGAALLMPEGEELVLVHGVGIGARYIGYRIPCDDRDPAARVFRERRATYINDTAAHPDWIDWQDDDIILSWMGAPLVIGGRTSGVLTADHAAAGMYGPDDLRNLQTFADIAAVAIDNAKRYQHAHLVAAEEERKRLARDLHDSVSQTLFSANLIAGLLPELWDLDSTRGRGALGDLQRLTRGAQAEMRTLLLEMHASALIQAPLDELLPPLVVASSAKIASEIDLQMDRAPLLPPDVQIAFYRIAQEALNNIVRHAHAQRITAHLRVTPSATNGYDQMWAGEIRLEIADNGRGFDPAAAAQGRLGLVSLRERAATVGATLELDSQPGAGTQVCAAWSGRAGALKS